MLPNENLRGRKLRWRKGFQSFSSSNWSYGSTLYQPDQVDFPVEKSPFYFTKFKNKITTQPFTPSPGQSGTNIPAITEVDWTETFPSFDPESFTKTEKTNFYKGGESNAHQKMKDYIQSGGALHYSDTRNLFRGDDFSSLLGPWLANGALSPRTFLSELIAQKEKHPEKSENIHPLIEQLIWRDNFRFLFLRYGQKFFPKKGLLKSEHGMYNDREAFEQWRSGKTGQRIIDAFMHELKATGFMSNRGRMLVIFYLSKEMKVNWQWGDAWFESTLLDYDVCSNYGNWAYQSGRGTDSRVNRKFNLLTQAKKYDPDGAYVKQWKE